MSKSLAYKHYQRIITRWPVDALRPEVSFQKALQRRIDRRFNPQPIAADGSKDVKVVQTPPVPVDEKAELEQVNVLYSFLENRYMKKYPVSTRFTQPASNPGYYQQLLQEIHDAPQRSWFAALIHKWKGRIRLQ